MRVQNIVGCSADKGILMHVGEYQDYIGECSVNCLGYHTLGDVQYIGGGGGGGGDGEGEREGYPDSCGDIVSTLEDVQYIGGIP